MSTNTHTLTQTNTHILIVNTCSKAYLIDVMRGKCLHEMQQLLNGEESKVAIVIDTPL